MPRLTDLIPQASQLDPKLGAVLSRKIQAREKQAFFQPRL